MLELFPQGFEEIEDHEGVELVAYTDAGGEERLRAVFEGARTADIPGDWADRWRRFHQPVRVGRLWIGPPWEKPAPGAVTIVVDPGRAFGTGGHATTRLCLELLLELEPGSLVDVGCGSGVLAIAASKLGFDPVVALDHDPQAVEATRLNAEANAVSLDVRLSDFDVEGLPAADAAVANLSAELVAAVGPKLDVSRAITSGYIERYEPELSGFLRIDRRTHAGWAADLHERE